MNKNEILPLLCILVFVFALFYPSLSNESINWDDPENIWQNTAVHALDFNHLWRMFTEAPRFTYMPLTFLTFAVEYHFDGEDPFLYHFDSLLLHCAVVVLVYVFLRRLGLDQAGGLLGALIFGIHPLHVEPVVWISSRKDLLYSVFYLLSTCLYLGYLDTGRLKYYGFSFLAALASILAKPMAASLPFILLLLDWYRDRKFSWKIIFEKIPFATVIFLIGAISAVMHKDYPLQVSGRSIFIWCWTFSFYIHRFLFPINLNPLYRLPVPVDIVANPIYIASALTALVFFLSLFYLRKNKFFVFACAYYFFSIIFLLRFTERLKFTTTFVADRYMYLPSLGFCALAGAGAVFLWRKLKNPFYRKISAALTILILAVFSLMSFAHTKIWSNSIIFWNRVIEKNPDVINAYVNRGNAFFDRGDYEKAFADFEQAIRHDPHEAQAYASRGACQIFLGQPQSAMADFNQAIALDPNQALAFYNRSLLFAQRGDYGAALADARRAKRLGYPVPLSHLMFLSTKAGLPAK